MDQQQADAARSRIEALLVDGPLTIEGLMAAHDEAYGKANEALNLVPLWELEEEGRVKRRAETPRPGEPWPSERSLYVMEPVKVPHAGSTAFEVIWWSGEARSFGEVSSFPGFDEAVTAARTTLRVEGEEHGEDHATVVLRCSWADAPHDISVGGIGELMRWEVSRDRVAVIPRGQGGLTHAQRLAVERTTYEKHGFA